MINIDQLLVKFAEARYKVAAPQGVPPQSEAYYQAAAPNFSQANGNLVEDPRLTAGGSTPFIPSDAQGVYDSASPVLRPDGTYEKDVAVHQGMGNPLNPLTQGFYAMPGIGGPGTGLGGSLATGALGYMGAKAFQNRALLNPNSYVPGQPQTFANLKAQPAQNFVERYTGGNNLGGLSVSNRDSPELNRNKPNPVIDAVGPKQTLSTMSSDGRAQSLMDAVRNKGVGRGVPMPGDQNSNALMGERGSTIQRPPVAAKDAPKGFGRILRPAPPSSVNLPANNTNMGGWRGALRAAAPRALGGIARPSTGAGRWAPLAAGVAGMALPMLANYSSDLTGAGIDPNEQARGITSLGMPAPQKVLAKATVPVPGN